MSREVETTSDGAAPRQVVSATEGDDSVDGGGKGTVSREKYENLEAKIDMLADSFTELRSGLAQRSAASSAQEVEDEFDDEEPLTASKVAKIVAKQTQAATSAQAAKSERVEWDRKAATDFPLTDPKFQLEFKRQWRDLSNAGMDVRHPRALYQAAKLTAQIIETNRKATSPGRERARKEDEDEAHDSEAPTSRQSAATRRASKSSIDDGDPRIAFYKMKGNKSEAQVKAFKERLAQKDAKRRNANER